MAGNPQHGPDTKQVNPPSPTNSVEVPDTPSILDMVYGKYLSNSDYRLRRLERGTIFKRGGNPVSNNAQFNAQGSTLGKVANSALVNGQVDPTKGGVLAKGSTPQTISAPNFTFTAGSPTTLTISWTAYASRRADGNSIVLLAGSIAITGLTGAVLYYYHPFWSEAAMKIGWVNGSGIGTPQIAYTSIADTSYQTQNLQGNFSFGIISFTQPAAGASGGTSGNYGSGGSGGGGRTGRLT